ncbi:PRAME family member 9/15 [Heterocephalus glaber]|nr:PRAME family member 9/15 [Heterocephalus glaber]
MHRLVREKNLAIKAREDLPREIIETLFMEALSRGHNDFLKAIVPAWPFYYLPLGMLMSMRRPEASETHLSVIQKQSQNLQILQAVLDGLDVLLAQKVRPRRWKLQVLDLRNTQQDFWKASTENLTQACSPVAVIRKMERTGPYVAEKQPLKVTVDLYLRVDYPGGFLSYLFEWVYQRKASLQLDCGKLPIESIIKIMKTVDLDCVQEVDLGPFWTLSNLAYFAPYLGQMQNLHKLFLSHISGSDFIFPERSEMLANQFISQFPKLHCLQEIYIESVSFLKGHLDQVLRYLKSPLKTLSITHSQLSHSDWKHLSQCLSLSHLKHLYLRGVRLIDFSPEPLRVLLDKVAGTLTILHLEACGIRDSQLKAIIPSLSHCSKLTTFNYIRNCISVATLENLLRCTARLSNLRLEQYAVPWEIYCPHCPLQWLRVEQIRDALVRIVKPLNHPRRVWFRTTHCHLSDNETTYHCPDYIPI